MNDRPHPCPAPKPQWWASRDEEILTTGPLDTREDAINEALFQGDFNEIEPEGYDFSMPLDAPENKTRTDWKAEIWVGQYRRRHIDLSKWFDADAWVEDLTDRMDDENGADENGDHHPLEELTKADIAALEESVRLAIWHWQHRRQIKLCAYYMDLVSGGECEVLPHPENPSPKGTEHA